MTDRHETNMCPLAPGDCTCIEWQSGPRPGIGYNFPLMCYPHMMGWPGDKPAAECEICSPKAAESKSKPRGGFEFL
jgi:hypothetical protein